MSNALSEQQAMLLHADLIHEIEVSETKKIIYAGYFRTNRGDGAPNGCIIRRTIIDKTDTGSIVEIKYAGGDNRFFNHRWEDRETLDNYTYSHKP